MRKPNRQSMEELVNENINLLLRDKEALEKIEEQMEKNRLSRLARE